MKRIFFLLRCLFVATITSHAEPTVQLIWSYNSPVTHFQIFGPNGTTPLDGAGTGADSDGFILQLGYYSLATPIDPFAGTWTPVFGPGTSNSLFATAGMGDGTGASGTDINFSFSGTVDANVPSTEVGIPSTMGQIMSIQYYNSATLSGSGAATYYGAVSDDAWTWVSPSDPAPTGMSFSLMDPGVVYEGGVSEAETNILIDPIPEPANLFFMAGAMAAGVLVLRRRK